MTAAVWYVGHVFTVPVSGGAPTPVQPEFASALYPVWSADGARLLFLGGRDPKDLPVGTFDWWIAPVSGGPVVKTGALDILRGQDLVSGRGGRWLIAPDEWRGDEVFFSAGADDHLNLWRLHISATGQADGPAYKLTSGTSTETKLSALRAEQIVFASVSTALNIWSLPVAANRGTVTGAAQQVTSSAFDARTSVSADGRKLVFLSTRLGNLDVWMKDLESGREAPLSATAAREEEPEISADGSRVSYSVFEGDRGVVYQMTTAGGAAEKICDDCGRPWDWSPDGGKLLYLIVEGRRGPNIALGLLDVAARKQTDYIVSQTYSVARVRFSPDGRWISFSAVNRQPTAAVAAGTHVVVAPFRPDAPPREDEWIPITPHRPYAQDKSRWSPDGNLLYYVSDIDGFRCIWAQRLDPATKRPIGDPLAVHHSHSARRSIMNVGIPLFFELSLTSDRLFFNMSETTGNIWMAEWPSP
jgi:WD40 repeat protein